MHTNLQVAIRQFKTMQGIIYVFTSWRINTNNIDSSKINPISDLFLRNRPFLAFLRQACIGGFAELSDLDIVLKKNSVGLGCWVSYLSDSTNVVC